VIVSLANMSGFSIPCTAVRYGTRMDSTKSTKSSEVYPFIGNKSCTEFFDEFSIFFLILVIFLMETKNDRRIRIIISFVKFQRRWFFSTKLYVDRRFVTVLYDPVIARPIIRFST